MDKKLVCPGCAQSFKKLSGHIRKCEKYKNWLHNIELKLSYEFLYDEYINKKKGSNQIAEELGLTRNTIIKNKLIEYNIPLKTASESAKECQHKIEETNLKKYGVKNVFNCKEIKDKAKATTLKNYGVECNLSSPEIRKNIRKTNLERYGVENSCEAESIKQKIKETNLERYGCEYAIASKKVQKKIKKISLEKYGTEFPFHSDGARQKIKENLLINHQVDNIAKIPEIKEKIQKMMLETYGTISHLSSPKIRAKIKSTNIKKYGTPYPNQTQEVKDKILKTKASRHYTYGHTSKIAEEFFLALYERLERKSHIVHVSTIYKPGVVTQREIGKRLSVSPTYISQLLQIANLPESVTRILKGHDISIGKLKGLIVYNGKEKLKKKQLNVWLSKKNRKKRANGETRNYIWGFFQTVDGNWSFKDVYQRNFSDGKNTSI